MHIKSSGKGMDEISAKLKSTTIVYKKKIFFRKVLNIKNLLLFQPYLSSRKVNLKTQKNVILNLKITFL